ncbi:restriction endonuclease [uncultured Thiodictyon sp.]|uniref:putative PDDEXK endonuclease n=1 Tax=uncultured Thiodictyon sp. TaxID=1846217 RepID=UPI0025DCEC99|nr:restriction endonuclease [uncultured Thiodictyon sp.]
MQRTKGATAERELAALIFDELGVKLVRNLDQSRRGGHDLIVTDDETGPVAASLARYALEVKRHAATPPGSVRAWWGQAESQAARVGLVPALAYRADRGAWRFVLPLVELRPDLTRAPGIEYTADLSLPAFCAVVREGTR